MSTRLRDFLAVLNGATLTVSKTDDKIPVEVTWEHRPHNVLAWRLWCNENCPKLGGKSNTLWESAYYVLHEEWHIYLAICQFCGKTGK